VLSRSAAQELEQLLGARGEGDGSTEPTEAAEAPAKPKRTRKPKQDEEAA
jgi:hypothetical protein